MENLIMNLLKNKKLTIEEISNELNIDIDTLTIYIKRLLDEEKILFDGEKIKLNKIKRKSPKLLPILDKSYILDKLIISCRNIHELTKLCNSNKKELEPILNELIEENKIVKYDDYYFYIIELTINILESKTILGRGIGTYKILNSRDVYDNDIALCLIIHENEEALFYKLVKRGHDYAIGEIVKKIKKDKVKYYLKSTMKGFKPLIKIEESDLLNALEGEIVKGDLNYTNNGIFAKVTKVIGHKDDPSIEITKIALEFGFELDFSEEANKELEEIENEVKKEDLEGRIDYTNLNVITIDGSDSKDFDDAVYLEKTNDSYKLYVFIADVSHYVKYNSALDKEALKRGTSCYLADRVIPMLPHKLSNGICSLNPNELRLVLACQMEYNLSGKLLNYDINEGYIISHHRMTYEDVNKIFDNDKELIDKYNDIYDMLLNMREFSKIIRNIRNKKGALEFDTIEYSFKLNEDGSPKEIIKRERFDSEMLIEDFMLEANQTVAYHMNLLNLPIIYRVHENPDQDKLKNTLDEIRTLGVKFKKSQNEIHPHELQQILNSLDDNPNKYIINNILLRSMMKAKYSNLCLGHYGLAMKYYCHFTSPIRRYPDLMTHRMIKLLLLHPTNRFNDDLKYFNSILEEIALKNSVSERKSIDLERECNDMLYAWYMEKNIGKTYQGIISSITNFGIFVDLGLGCEGLFLYRMSMYHYDYSEKTKTCFNGLKTFKMGDKIKVSILESNRENREILLLPEGDTLYENNRDK